MTLVCGVYERVETLQFRLVEVEGKVHVRVFFLESRLRTGGWVGTMCRFDEIELVKDTRVEIIGEVIVRVHHRGDVNVDEDKERNAKLPCKSHVHGGVAR